MPGRPAPIRLQAAPCCLSPEEAILSLAEATKLLLAIDARRRTRQDERGTGETQESLPPEVKAAA